MATLRIPDATYLRLKEMAEALRLSVDQYLDQVAVSGAQFPGDVQQFKAGTPEWLEAFDAWISSHPARPFVADDSRDAIYGDERD